MPLTHPKRSPAVSFPADGLGRRLAARDGGTPAQALAQLLYGRPLGQSANLGQQVIGKGHTGEGSLRLERAMQPVGNVAKLNHARHVHSILTCVTHVKAPNLLREHGWQRRGMPGPHSNVFHGNFRQIALFLGDFSVHPNESQRWNGMWVPVKRARESPEPFAETTTMSRSVTPSKYLCSINRVKLVASCDPRARCKLWGTFRS